MPSKKVYLKRSRAFVHGQIKSAEAQELLARGKRGVGGFYANKHTNRKGTGLTNEEIMLIMPQVLDIHPNDLEFRKKVDNFFNEVNTDVPFGDLGVEFEIGLELDNEKPVTYFEELPIEEGSEKKIVKRNTPINFEEWVKYKHAMAHPWVAPTPEEAKGNTTFQFYFEDPIQVAKSKVSESEIVDKALALYQMIKEDRAKTKMMLTIMFRFLKKKTKGEVIYVNKLTPEDAQIYLRTLALEKPVEFLKNGTDDDLKFKYRLTELIRVGLVKQAGTSYLIAESGEPLGVGIDEASDTLFKDRAKAQVASLLKAQYDDLVLKE